MEKCHYGNGLRIIYFIQCWPWGVKKLETDCRTRFWNYYQIWQGEKLTTWLLSSGQDFGKNFLDSKHVLKVYFKPSRKNPYFLFLPLSSQPVWLKIHCLITCSSDQTPNSETTNFFHENELIFKELQIGFFW